MKFIRCGNSDHRSLQVIVEMTPSAIDNTGWKIYILFCIMLVLGIPFVYFFLPEVSGLHSSDARINQ